MPLIFLEPGRKLRLHAERPSSESSVQTQTSPVNPVVLVLLSRDNTPGCNPKEA